MTDQNDFIVGRISDKDMILPLIYCTELLSAFRYHLTTDSLFYPAGQNEIQY